MGMVLFMLVLLDAILLNRSFEAIPAFLFPLPSTATMENCWALLFFWAAVSLRRLLSSSLATAGIQISSPLKTQFHPRVRDSLSWSFMNPDTIVVASSW